MFFAEVSSVQAGVTWMVGAAGAAVVINEVMKLVDRVKGKPSTGEVMRESTDRFVAKSEFRDHVQEDKQEHQNLWKKIGGMERGGVERMDSLSREWREFVDAKFEEMRASSDQGREKLHGRINEILGQVSELKGKME